MTNRYFTHKDKFADKTLYLRVDDNKLVWVRTTEKEYSTPYYSILDCEKMVLRGKWIEIMEAQALAMLNAKKKTHVFVITIENYLSAEDLQKYLEDCVQVPGAEIVHAVTVDEN